MQTTTPGGAPPADAEAVLRRLASVEYWWHNMPLFPGIRTPGHDMPAERKAEYIQLPASFAGQSVLDIGTAEGYFAFEAERRGASRVLAIDRWQSPGFAVARDLLGSAVQFRLMSVLDATPEELGGPFDTVFFFGVLYHLQNPMLALERLRPLVRRQLLVETYVDASFGEEKAARFYEKDELNGDPTNWWGPSPACVEAMLRAVGFSEVRRLPLFNDRGVFHARP